VLLAALGLILAEQVTAQTFKTLYNFTALYQPNLINSDGAYPNGGLMLSGNTLFGTANAGGTAGSGTVFALNTDGTGFSVLHSFNATCIPCRNSGGGHPYAGLVLSGTTLYGTTAEGGSGAVGTVFAVNTDGTGFTTMHNFTFGVDGASPTAELILSGNTLYGTTVSGGSPGYGTVFGLNTGDQGFTNLYSFTSLLPDYTSPS